MGRIYICTSFKSDGFSAGKSPAVFGACKTIQAQGVKSKAGRHGCDQSAISAQPGATREDFLAVLNGFFMGG